MEWIPIVFLLGFSAFFSGFESALFSLSLFDRHRMKQAGGVSSLILKSLERPREVLSTILLGNEMVNVTISILAASLLYRHFHYEEHSRSDYLLSVGVTTLIILIFGEIVPKNIAVRNSTLFAQFLIIPYQLFSLVVTPLRIVLTKVIDLLLGLFGIEVGCERRLIVEEEIKSLLELGRREGTLDELERGLIQNVFDFSTVEVSEVMTPREKIVAIPDTASVADVFKRVEEVPFSRFPVYRGELNHILGIFLTKNLLPCRLADPEMAIQLTDFLIPYAVVTPRMNLDEAFFTLRSQQVHMALVREGERVVGLVTMDDLLRRFFK